MNHQAQVDRAAKAEAILRSDLFNEVFSEMKAGIFARMEQLDPLADAQEATQLLITLKLLRAVRAKFEQAVRDGKYAAVRLDEEQRKQ